jgi:4-O-beta-D-mannosyl-D-glucose phosphorylase
MPDEIFVRRLKTLADEHKRLLKRKNEKLEPGNGIFGRYRYPVLTAEHTPLFWRYDLNLDTNPYLMGENGHQRHL